MGWAWNMSLKDTVSLETSKKSCYYEYARRLIISLLKDLHAEVFIRVIGLILGQVFWVGLKSVKTKEETSVCGLLFRKANTNQTKSIMVLIFSFQPNPNWAVIQMEPKCSCLL